MSTNKPAREAAVNDRVTFLYPDATGPDNTGTVMDIAPCKTWGRMAQVRWDSGETGFARLFDLCPTEPVKSAVSEPNATPLVSGWSGETARQRVGGTLGS